MLLKYGTLGGGEAWLTAPLAGKLLPATMPPERGLIDFAMSFAVLPPVPLATHPWVSYVRDRNEFDLEPRVEVLADKRWPGL